MLEFQWLNDKGNCYKMLLLLLDFIRSVTFDGFFFFFFYPSRRDIFSVNEMWWFCLLLKSFLIKNEWKWEKLFLGAGGESARGVSNISSATFEQADHFLSRLYDDFLSPSPLSALSRLFRDILKRFGLNFSKYSKWQWRL